MMERQEACLDIQVFATLLRITTVDELALHRVRSQSAAMTKRLPNGGQAILDMRKIEDYCLNPSHPRGRHKARVFREALDLQRSDASWLRDALLEAARSVEAIHEGRTLGGRIGASMRTSGDKEKSAV